MKCLSLIFSGIILVLAICSTSLEGSAQTSSAAEDSIEVRDRYFSHPNFASLRDTLYVCDSVYLEVRLDKQMIYQHFRNGSVKPYSCSTGNPRQPDAIATREGLFQIQWKSKRYMSSQFQVWLNYWMPFDGGIGFHGLDGRSYYRYLGRRPSSHGCVRISNETGKSIFASAPSGTLVFVHSGAPARVLQFADTTEEGMTIVTQEHQELLDQRLKAVLERRVEDTTLQIRLALPAGKKDFRKIALGKAGHLAPVQYTIQPIRIPLLNELPAPKVEIQVEPVAIPDVQPIEDEHTDLSLTR